MGIIKIIDRLRYMDYLIAKESTGPPQEFARRIGLSRSMLYENIDEMRTLGAPIRYDRKRKTFFYYRPFELRIDFEDRSQLNGEERRSA